VDDVVEELQYLLPEESMAEGAEAGGGGNLSASPLDSKESAVPKLVDADDCHVDELVQTRLAAGEVRFNQGAPRAIINEKVEYNGNCQATKGSPR